MYVCDALISQKNYSYMMHTIFKSAMFPLLVIVCSIHEESLKFIPVCFLTKKTDSCGKENTYEPLWNPFLCHNPVTNKTYDMQER